MYDILVILVDRFLWKFSMILAVFLLPGSVSLKRIRLTKMKRIQTDPDPKHWLYVLSFLHR